MLKRNQNVPEKIYFEEISVIHLNLIFFLKYVKSIYFKNEFFCLKASGRRSILICFISFQKFVLF